MAKQSVENFAANSTSHPTTNDIPLRPHPDHALAQLGFVDVQANPRIAETLDTVKQLSQATDPLQVTRLLSGTFRDVFEPDCLVSVSTRGVEAGEYLVTRWFAEDGTNRVETDNPWRDKAKLKKYTGGFIAQVVAQPQPKLVHNLSVQDDPMHGDALAAYRSMIAVPTFTNGEAKNWVLLFRTSPTGFTHDDLEEALIRSNLVGAMVANILNVKKLRELNERMHEEVRRIAAIQRALLPSTLPQIPGAALAASYQTYDTAGGDMYDFARLDFLDDARQERDNDGRWGLLIADVSGHGPSAAVVMAMLHAIIRSFPHSPQHPGEALAYANQHLCDKRIEESFVTAFLAFYDPKTRAFTYARAGHNPPLVKIPPDRGGGVTYLDKVGDLPLGIMDGVTYDHTTIQLHPGDTVVLYTDGITEAKAPSGSMFEVKGIELALQHCTGEPQCVIEWIQTVLRRHEAGVQPSDDQTLVAMQILNA